MSLSKEQKHYVCAHPTFFLPIELPKHPSGCEDAAAFQCFAEFVKSQNWTNFVGKSSSSVSRHIMSERKMKETLNEFLKLHQLAFTDDDECDMSRITAGEIKKNIAGMDVGSYRAIWVKAQNSVLLIHRESTESVLVFSWEIQALKGEVMLQNAAVRHTIPRSGVRAKFNQVKNEAFAELVCDLASQEQPKAFPQSQKAGEQFKESRDVPNPMY